MKRVLRTSAGRRLGDCLVALFPWRIALSRVRRPARSGSGRLARPWRWRARLSAVAGAAAVAAGVSALPASASTSGSVEATLSVAVRSLNVSPQVVSFDSCDTALNGTSTGTTLGFPNGFCYTESSDHQVTIANGPVPGIIDVQGANAVPSDDGTNWTLCWAATCTGSGGDPGQDQFTEWTGGGALAGPALTDSPQCDDTFTGTAGDCSAAAGQAATELLSLIGPSSSSDGSSQFETSVTWTELP